jgi:hypothetical protein
MSPNSRLAMKNATHLYGQLMSYLASIQSILLTETLAGVELDGERPSVQSKAELERVGGGCEQPSATGTKLPTTMESVFE